MRRHRASLNSVAVVRSVPLSRRLRRQKFDRTLRRMLGNSKGKFIDWRYEAIRKTCWLGWETERNEHFWVSWAWNIVQFTFLTVQDIAAPGSAPIHSYWSPFETGFSYYTFWLSEPQEPCKPSLSRKGPELVSRFCLAMGQQPRGDQQSILKGNDILQDSKMSAVPHYSTLTRQGRHKGAGSGGEGVVAVGWRDIFVPIIYWSYSFIFIQRLEYCTIHCR